MPRAPSSASVLSEPAVSMASPSCALDVLRQIGFGRALLAALVLGLLAMAALDAQGRALALEPAEVARALDPSVVRIYVEGPAGKISGTGFVVDRKGHVVTNFHVVAAHAERDWPVFVLRSGDQPDERLPAEVVETLPGEDLAVLQIVGLGRPPVHFPAATSEDGVVKGLEVFAIGFPGAADRLGPVDETSFAPGAVSRVFSGSWSADGPKITIIQHTAPTNPGNSGGPLVNACGEVIGVNAQREARMVVAPGGIPLVSDPIQGVFFSLDAAVLLAQLDRLAIPYARATEPCVPEVAAREVAKIYPYLLVTILVAMAAAAFAVIYKPRPVVRVVVRCGEMVEECVTAIRRAMANRSG